MAVIMVFNLKEELSMRNNFIMFFSRLVAVIFLTVCFVENARADSSTVTASKVASASASWTGSSGETWSIVVDGGATNQNVTNNYAQVGTRNSPSTSVTFSTSGITGTITSIVIDCASYSGIGTVDATVGGNAFGTQSQSIPSWSSNTGGEVTFSGSASGAIVVTMTNGNNGRAMYIKSITVTYSTGGGTPTCATPTFSPAEGTYTSTQSVSISTETDGATIYYTTDGSTPTTSSTVYSSAISVSSNSTIKAIAVKDGYNNSSVASASYVIVTLEHAGTKADPYSVADARNAIDAGVGITDVYATGIVSEIVTAYNPSYGNISYNISSDGETSSAQLQAYRGKSYDGEDFTSAGDIRVGDEVVVFGTLKKYNSTYEFEENNQLVSLVRPAVPSIVVSTASLSGFTYEEDSGPSDEKTFTVSGSDLTENIAVGLSGSNYEMSLSSGSGYTSNLSLTQTAGAVPTTTVYVRLKEGLSTGEFEDTITLSSEGATSQTVILSGEVTERPVPAVLPFDFDDGRDKIDSTDGLYQEGLGTDYASSPKLKFDNTGDYLILMFDERPGVLRFNIKNNSFSGGTFKVQTSVDGSSFTDLATYTEIASTQNEEFTSIDADVRYIKWIYTNKSNGNVGLGNISLSKYVAPLPSITISSDNIDASALDEVGTLDLTYENISISDESDFAVQFYDSESNEVTDPSWLIVLVEENGTGGYRVAYDIEANSGTARTAYFKVWALDDVVPVYSNLVTVNQAGVPLSYASLPFAFNSGRSEIANTDGLSHSGLGTDYSVGSNPNTILKFDTADDYLVLKINEAPGTLKFNIKGNGSGSDPWAGTFKVQVSANGEDYTDVASYTSLGDVSSETISDLASDVRYIKWVYTTKTAGNVGLGNISLTKPASNPATITITATENGGKYYTTFYNGSARYVLPAGAKAFSMNSSHQLYQLGTDGSVIPAETAVIIIADKASITLTKSDDASSIAVNGGANILKGSNSPTAVLSISGTPYVLGVVGGVLGVYEFTGEGIPAYKAYLED